MSYKSKRLFISMGRWIEWLTRVFMLVMLIAGIVFLIVATVAISVVFVSAIQGDIAWH